MTKISETKELKAEFIAREVDFPDIAKTITNKIISERSKSYACNSVWASEVAHDCERYLVYQQCDWEKAKPVDDSLLLVFNEGNVQEDQLLLELQKAHDGDFKKKSKKGKAKKTDASTDSVWDGLGGYDQAEQDELWRKMGFEG